MKPDKIGLMYDKFNDQLFWGFASNGGPFLYTWRDGFFYPSPILSYGDRKKYKKRSNPEFQTQLSKSIEAIKNIKWILK